MANRTEVRTHQSRPPVQEDRCTVVFLAHYQEWENPTTSVDWKYDRTLPADNIPYQRNIKVGPASDLEKRTKITLGDLAFGNCEIFFGHNPIKITSDDPSASLLQEMQKLNTIRITDSNGKLVAEIKPGRMAFGQFAGPLFASASHATALLSITAMPV